MFYRVGVPDAERSQPQRLLLTVVLESDFTAAAKSDSIADTIDYYAVTQRLLKFGENREWKLIEKLAADIAGFILAEFKPLAVTVEVKKFIIPESRHVAVTLTQYVFKVLWEVAATPLTYWIVGFLKRTEHEDYYDRHTNFTPFSLRN